MRAEYLRRVIGCLLETKRYLMQINGIGRALAPSLSVSFGGFHCRSFQEHPMRAFFALTPPGTTKLAIEAWRDKAFPRFYSPVKASNFHITHSSF